MMGLTAGNVGVRNVGAEKHALAFLEDDKVEEKNAPTAHVARKIGRDPAEQFNLQRFLLLVA